MASPDFFLAINTLLKHEADFIVVGGVCAVLHGVPITTLDLDIVHKRTDENIERVLAALSELDAHFRFHPKLIEPNQSHLVGPGHSLLETAAGALDVLGTIDEGKGFDELVAHSQIIFFDGKPLRLLTLEMLIEIKERAGRSKDLVVIPILKHTLTIRDNNDGAS